LKKQGDEPVDELLGKILARDPTAPLLDCARRAGLMGALLNDLAAWQYRLPPPLERDYRDLLTHILSIFGKEAARRLPFETRLEAVEALGRAGDPRLAEGIENWVRVEGAEFALGETGRQVRVAPFLMARYPVTVTEYERFVHSDAFDKLSEPKDWEYQLFYPNRPVAWVRWFEACAYCAWKGVRLPYEEEWECAARCGREGAEYPWGAEDPDEFRANYHHGGSPHAPTPVGMYPEGATPSGIQDLAGNVWEWTFTGSEEERYRTVRGGGWGNSPRNLRVSFRGRSVPERRHPDIGFRCARDLPY
jgi:hypothetical protein